MSYSVYETWEKVYKDCLAALCGDLHFDTLMILLILSFVFFSGYAHIIFEDADRRNHEIVRRYKGSMEPDVQRGRSPSESTLALQRILNPEYTLRRDSTIDNDWLSVSPSVSEKFKTRETSTTHESIDGMAQEFILSGSEPEGAWNPKEKNLIQTIRNLLIHCHCKIHSVQGVAIALWKRPATATAIMMV